MKDKDTGWLRGAVIYHIFIDRFAGFTSIEKAMIPDYMGGNIPGITDKLPYIEDLGVNAIWISPFYKGGAYHGYETTDLYQVDEHFGTENDLKKLIAQAHKRGLKIICDFVPNHVSYKHPFFLDAKANPNSQYRDWFIFDRWPKKYRTFLGVKELPKLNLDNPAAMEHILGAARKWMSLGFDGLRLDHVIGLSNENVRGLVEPLREEFPGSIFIGEAWFSNTKFRDMKTIRVPRRYRLWVWWWLGGDSNAMLYHNYRDMLDGVLNFEGAELLEKYVKARTRWSKKRAADKLIARSKAFGSKLLLPTFLDNHDMERFLFKCNDDVELLQKAARLQFLLKQPAVIYYGTEIGMSQKRPFKARKKYGDLYCRQPMQWNPANQNKSLLEFYKALVRSKLSKTRG